ncbi:MAG: hypothetical protein H0Z24_08285 [Thermosipho sp. (in: Bacteria)]|nr:hypothetical protein [Thermosipho sp. (in: thermotogales)]
MLLVYTSISFSEPLIYNFIKNISGKRDFYFSVDILFDVIDNQQNNFRTNISLEATVINLENITVNFISPEFLKDIEINYNTINNIAVYKYKNNISSEVTNFNLEKLYEIFKTAAGFLSSSVFTVTEDEDSLIFVPTGYVFLKRLGLEPTKIYVNLNEYGFSEFLFSTDDSTETVTIKFNEFKILNIK